MQEGFEVQGTGGLVDLAAPASDAFDRTVKPGLEACCRKDGLKLERLATDIGEAMAAERRHDKRLAGQDDDAFLFDPHLGLAGEHRQDLLNGMMMRRSARAGRHPLLEQAQLRGAVHRGDHHPRFDAGAP
ncbi:hypothetical protein D9M72_402000 [compost metagenome]